MKRLIWLAIFLLSVLLSYGQISMQSSNAGFSLQAEYGYGMWKSEDFGVDREGGQSMGVRLGYGFSENWEAVAAFGSTRIKPDDFDFMPFRLNQVDLGAKYTFGSTLNPVRFHLAGYFSHISSKQEVFYDIFEPSLWKLSGAAGTVALGAKYHIALPVAISLDAAMTMGSYRQNYLDGFEMDPIDYQGYRITLGVIVYFNQL